MHTLLIVPPASVRSFEQELLSTTALTPTHHKGGIGKVLGIVAAIAIPFAAPAIATAIGVSGALSGALIGAGLGAATAAITGQNIGMGALTGGIGGGIGGYMNAPAGTNPFTGSTIQSGSAFGGPPIGSPDFIAAQGGIPTTAGVQSSLGTGSGVGLQDMLPGTNVNDPTYGLSSAGSTNPGATLSGGGGYTQQVSYSPTDSTSLAAARDAARAQSYAGGNFAMDESGQYINLTTGEVVPTAAYGQPTLNTNMGAVRGIPTSTPLPRGIPQGVMNDAQRMTQLGGVQSTPTFGDRLAGLGDSVSGFFNDPMAAIKKMPDYAKYSGVQAGTRALSGLFTPDQPDMSPMETAALEDRKRLRQMEEAAQARNQALGDQYMQQAQAINPVNFGFETAAAQSARLQRGQQAGLRNLTGAQRTAAQRRAALDQARIGGSAFNQGYGRGLQERMAGISRAAGTGANYSNLGTMATNDLITAQTYRDRLNKEQANAAGLISPVLAGGLFGMTDAERRELDKKRREISGAGIGAAP